MSLDNLPLLIILVISVLGNNQSVAVASGFLLIIKLLGFDNWFPILENKGMNIGITILTIAILAPLASGRFSLKEAFTGFCSPIGIIALAAGIFVAWVAGRGLIFINTSPEMVGVLVLGTTFGVCFLHGVAIGPLIASGLVSLSIVILNALK